MGGRKGRDSLFTFPYLQVTLPAEWHTLHSEIETMGSSGLARAKTGWLKYTAKLQIINGCVDFLNLSKLIQNAKIDPKAVLEPDSSDEEQADEPERLEDTYRDDALAYTELAIEGIVLLIF